MTVAMLMVAPLCYSQSPMVIYQDAESYMRQEKYDLAIAAFGHIPDMPDVGYKVTICSLMSKQYKNLSIERYLSFEGARSKDPLFYYWLGKIHFNRLAFDEAGRSFQKFLDDQSKDGKLASYLGEARTRLKYLQSASPSALIKLESPLNSKYAEYGGIFIGGADHLIFASDRKEEGRFEMYQSKKGPYGWDSPELIFDAKIPADRLNILPYREGMIFYDPAVSALCVIDYTEDAGWTKAEKVETPDLSDARHVYVNKYRTRVVFSQKTTTGDLDIMEAFKLRSSGEWMDPVIISTQVNSSYNEDYPYVTDDRLRIYFSSDRPGGLGKMDIYYCEFDDVNNTWGQPVNMGLPVNSADDDVDFRITSDGKAILSSNRFDSIGDFDLFMVDLKD